MRKTPLVTAVVLITIILSSTHITTTLASEPVWGVTPGDSYNFDLNYVEIYYSLPPVEYNATGITFDNDSFVEQNSIIAFNVTNVNEILIEYDLEYNTTIENNFRISSNFSDELTYLLNLPLELALMETNASDIQRGFTGIDYLVVPTENDTWDEFTQYGNPIYLAYTEGEYPSEVDIDIEGLTTINNDTDECVFDWYMNGTYIEEANGTDIQFVYNLKMAYEISTGILLGMRVDLETIGENAGNPITVIIRSEVERDGYNLADFLLPSDQENFDIDEILSNLFPGYGWLVVPITLVSVVLIGIKKRERK